MKANVNENNKILVEQEIRNSIEKSNSQENYYTNKSNIDSEEAISTYNNKLEPIPLPTTKKYTLKELN